MNYAHSLEPSLSASGAYSEPSSSVGSTQKNNVIVGDFGRNFSQPATSVCRTYLYAEKAGSADIEALLSKWISETAHLSQISRIKSHRTFQELSDSGWTAVLSVEDKLRSSIYHWHFFLLLKSILNVDPVPNQDRGKPELMADAWLDYLEKEAVS